MNSCQIIKYVSSYKFMQISLKHSSKNCCENIFVFETYDMLNIMTNFRKNILFLCDILEINEIKVLYQTRLYLLILCNQFHQGLEKVNEVFFFVPKPYSSQTLVFRFFARRFPFSLNLNDQIQIEKLLLENFLKASRKPASHGVIRLRASFKGFTR